MKRRWTLLACLGLAACSGRQTPLGPAGDQAYAIYDVWTAMMIICGLMYVLVLGFLAWAIWRRRSNLGLAPATGHTAAEPAMEKGLVGWSVLVVVGLTVLITVSFLVDRKMAEAGPRPLNIKVTANQWWWAIEYEDADPSRTLRTANELHLPLGRPVHVELHSNDVIHSFWIPNLAGKEDLIPGRVNSMIMTPRRTGVFRGQCAEFCGLQHAHMALDVTVQSPQDYEAWREAQVQPAIAPTNADLAEGQALFLSRACMMCHAIAGTTAGGVVGPDLTHVASRRSIAAGALATTQSNLGLWISDPTRIKPGTPMPKVKLSGDELAKITAYLASLK
ncbi:MAG TPA: cytochrome c oxidase subunit II [Caulobacteraceae bacterium]|nr:cytochrome c oxidase subunit II [Caulobacteraceae bacterium]